MYLDGTGVHVQGENGRVSQRTMDVAIGVNLQGTKELLSLWLSQTERGEVLVVVPERPEGTGWG